MVDATGRRKARVSAASLSRLRGKASTKLEELTCELLRLTLGRKGDGLSAELRDVVYTLKAHELRSGRNAHAFRVGGGLAALLRLVTGCGGRDAVLLLGAVGNLCALDTQSRREVKETALDQIVVKLRSSPSNDVCNTAARVLANVALDEEHRAAIVERGVVTDICHLLGRPETDSRCRQSSLRALTLLGRDREAREDLRENLSVLTAQLNSNDDAVLSAALRLTVVLTRDADPDFIQPLSCGREGSLPRLAALCSHTHPSIVQSAVSVLLQCAKTSEGRLGLAAAGGVVTLVRHLDTCEEGRPAFTGVVDAVCACCRDVLSRQQLRDCGGLERLIGMLSNSALSRCHGNVLSALICYYFDEGSLQLMVKELGLLRALACLLKHIVTLSVKQDAGGGASEQEAGGGGSEQEAGGGAPEQEEGGGASEQEAGGGAPGQEAVGGAPGQEMEDELSPSTEAKETTSMLVRGESASRSSSSVCSSCHGDLSSVAMSNEHLTDWGSEEEEEEKANSCIELVAKTGDVVSHDMPLIRPTPPTNLQPLSPPTPHQLLPDFVAMEADFLKSAPLLPQQRVPPLKPDLSAPVPPNFIESLLSSPSPYQQRPQRVQAPFPGEPGMTLEQQVVLLLSRISHLRCCLPALASPDILQHILRYFFSQASPNLHVFKLLCRVLRSPLCFQSCLLALTPSHLHRHLTEAALTPSHPHHHHLTEATLTPSHLHHHLTEATLTPSHPHHHHLTEADTTCCPSPHRVTQHSSLSSSPLTPTPPQCARPQSFPVPNDSSSSLCSLRLTPSIHSPTSPGLPLHCHGDYMFSSASRELLERLSGVAESPYGQGVLAHLLLRGEKREREASCLALPLLCRSPRMCQKLMIDYRGLELLVSMIKTEEEHEDEEEEDKEEEEEGEQEEEEEEEGEWCGWRSLHAMAVRSLLVLARTVCQERKRRLSVDTTSPLPPSKVHCHDSSFRDPAHCPSCLTSPTATPTPRTGYCQYRDSDHVPFDLIVHIGGAAQSERLPVHRSVLSDASDVFAAMLDGGYTESTGAEVSLRGVAPLAFQSLVHHSYGCGWLCHELVEELAREEEGRGQLPASWEQEGCGETLLQRTSETIIRDACAGEAVAGEQRWVLRQCLRVLACAGQYLLLQLCTSAEHLASSLLSPSNALAVLTFAQLHQFEWLSDACLQFITHLPPSRTSLRLFSALASSPQGLDLLLTFLEDRLQRHT